MYQVEDIFLEVDGRRRNRRNVTLECECEVVAADRDNRCGCGNNSVGGARDRNRHWDNDRNDVGGARDRNHHCGCDRDDDVGGARDRRRNHCKSCSCKQLKGLQAQTLVIIQIKDVILPLPAAFISFDKDTCCATFTILGASVTVDCRDIVAVAFPPPGTVLPTSVTELVSSLVPLIP